MFKDQVESILGEKDADLQRDLASELRADIIRQMESAKPSRICAYTIVPSEHIFPADMQTFATNLVLQRRWLQ